MLTHLGDVTASELKPAIDLGKSLVSNYASSVYETGSFLAPTFEIPVVGIIISFITSIFMSAFAVPTLPKNPQWFNLGLAIPIDSYPSVASVLLAATNFSTESNQHFSEYGSFLLSAGGTGYAFATFAKPPNPVLEIKKYFDQIESYQKQLITPFFMSVSNLTDERKAIIFNSTVQPPLEFGPTISGSNFAWVPKNFQTGNIYLSYTGLKDCITSGYLHFANVINAVFLRRLYLSVLDSPLTAVEAYGEVEPQVGGTAIVTEPNFIPDIPRPTPDNPFGFTMPIKGLIDTKNVVAISRTQQEDQGQQITSISPFLIAMALYLAFKKG